MEKKNIFEVLNKKERKNMQESIRRNRKEQ